MGSYARPIFNEMTGLIDGRRAMDLVYMHFGEASDITSSQRGWMSRQ